MNAVSRSIMLGGVAGLTCGLLIGLMVCEATEIGGWIVVLSVGLGTPLGGLLGRVRSPNVSIYWLWLVVTFVVIGQLAVITEMGYSLDPSTFHWESFLLGHALAAVCIAVVAAVRAELRQLRQRPEEVTRRFSLFTLLVWTFALGVVFGLLRWCQASEVFYVVVLLFGAGRLVTLLIVATVARFLSDSGLPEGESEPADND